MKSKQLRKKAWDALKGRYWWAVLAALIASLFGVVSLSASTGTAANGPEQFEEAANQALAVLPDNGKIALVLILCTVVIVGLAMSILGTAVRLGYCRFNMDLFTGVEKPTMNLLFSRTKIVWKALLKAILEGLLVAVGCIFFVVPGIIIGLMYSQSDYILAENPSLKVTEAMKKSREMMKGQKWKLFKLALSFIGWMILSGIVPAGVLLLTPYTEAAFAAFYLDRTGRLNENSEPEAKDLGDLEGQA